MKATGVVRRIDDLGRLVIPKDLRKSMNIKEGDPLEFFIKDEYICIRKYETEEELIERSFTAIIDYFMDCKDELGIGMARLLNERFNNMKGGI